VSRHRSRRLIERLQREKGEGRRNIAANNSDAPHAQPGMIDWDDTEPRNIRSTAFQRSGVGGDAKGRFFRCVEHLVTESRSSPHRLSYPALFPINLPGCDPGVLDEEHGARDCPRDPTASLPGAAVSDADCVWGTFARIQAVWVIRGCSLTDA